MCIPLQLTTPKGKVIRIDLRKPIATWTFIDPESAEAADAWVRENIEEASNGIAGYRMEVADVKRLQAALPEGHVRVLEQYSGDTVVVSPGWIHQVQNHQPCLKLAFDVFVASSFPAYIDSWLQVASKVTADGNATDYMAVNDVLAYAFSQCSLD